MYNLLQMQLWLTNTSIIFSLFFCKSVSMFKSKKKWIKVTTPGRWRWNIDERRARKCKHQGREFDCPTWVPSYSVLMFPIFHDFVLCVCVYRENGKGFGRLWMIGNHPSPQKKWKIACLNKKNAILFNAICDLLLNITFVLDFDGNRRSIPQERHWRRVACLERHTFVSNRIFLASWVCLHGFRIAHSHVTVQSCRPISACIWDFAVHVVLDGRICSGRIGAWW